MTAFDTVSRRRTRLALALVPLVLAGALTGCGSSGTKAAPKADGPAETWPACDQVWVAGHTLPQGYQGCVIHGNSVSVFSPEDCPSGAKYATYKDRWYAARGDTIHESKSGNVFHDPAFDKFTQDC